MANRQITATELKKVISNESWRILKQGLKVKEDFYGSPPKCRGCYYTNKLVQCVILHERTCKGFAKRPKDGANFCIRCDKTFLLESEGDDHLSEHWCFVCNMIKEAGHPLACGGNAAPGPQ